MVIAQSSLKGERLQGSSDAPGCIPVCEAQHVHEVHLLDAAAERLK